jgi:mannose-6-phosphate isomerase-like protein (cupin superfamily)
MASTLIHRFETHSETRRFERGRFEVLYLGNMSVGRATYQPGWRWSIDVGAASGQSLCQVEHVGYVLAGRAGVSFPDGTCYELTAGDAFYIPPGHDSWVIGEEPYVSLHVQGAESYAT